MTKARERLVLLWIAFFILNLATSLYLLLSQEIEGDNFKILLTELNTAYAPYVGAILAFYWAHQKAPRAENMSRKQKLAAILALGFALVWNLLMSTFLLGLVVHVGNIQDSLDLMAFLRGIFTWFAAGSTGFFFGVGR